MCLVAGGRRVPCVESFAVLRGRGSFAGEVGWIGHDVFGGREGLGGVYFDVSGGSAG